MPQNDERDIRAALSFYVARPLPAHLLETAHNLHLSTDGWVYPGTSDGLPLPGEKILQELQNLGRSLRERAGTAGLLIPGDLGWPAGTGCDQLPCLWVRGNRDIAGLLSAAVAVTATRAGTPYGAATAADFASGLAEAGLTVVTSTALRVDQQIAATAVTVPGAHAVLVSDRGIDQPFAGPAASTIDRVIRDGALVSAFPPGTGQAMARTFVREQLLYQLAAGTVVVEAAAQPHTMLAARRAAEAGRIVCAVPGPAASPSSAGCHQLIAERTARLVTSTADVLAEIGEHDAELLSFAVNAENRAMTRDGIYGLPPFRVSAPSASHAANMALDLVARARTVGEQLSVDVQGPSGDIATFAFDLPA
ncbi:DNA-processing protein DprA [Actinoplanes sp. NPDC020271]|uniref:DNA-processing protein DprA n=1 Tax=Actinoplanes sp. NPDC020271 TaxID=3363896 RepID=UPI0037A782E7